ncbi:MAG: hypothetical protein AABX38_01790 [Candidatus Micrarchaeota archaeon]
MEKIAHIRNILSSRAVADYRSPKAVFSQIKIGDLIPKSDYAAYSYDAISEPLIKSFCPRIKSILSLRDQILFIYFMINRTVKEPVLDHTLNYLFVKHGVNNEQNICVLPLWRIFLGQNMEVPQGKDLEKSLIFQLALQIQGIHSYLILGKSNQSQFEDLSYAFNVVELSEQLYLVDLAKPSTTSLPYVVRILDLVSDHLTLSNVFHLNPVEHDASRVYSL